MSALRTKIEYLSFPISFNYSMNQKYVHGSPAGRLVILFLAVVRHDNSSNTSSPC